MECNKYAMIMKSLMGYNDKLLIKWMEFSENDYQMDEMHM